MDHQGFGIKKELNYDFDRINLYTWGLVIFLCLIITSLKDLDFKQ